MSSKILFLEPFYGGSHRDFADGLVKHSRHEITLYTLPARFWKWRMRGASLHFAREIPDPQKYDLLLVSDMLSLSDLKAMWTERCPPSVIYFHENQLSYPLPEGEDMDLHFGFTNIVSCLVAEGLLFNSHYQLNSFLFEMPRFIARMPEQRPHWTTDNIGQKARVLYPGCNFPSMQTPRLQAGERSQSPLILWNHRWEFDKAPERFFDAMEIIDEEGLSFQLALLGENFQALPKPFINAKNRFADRILQYGYVESKREYFHWLERADIVISTAIQENFGISIVEAMRCGCAPILPNRLSYPEILPEEFHQFCLYQSKEELVKKTEAVINDPGKIDTGQLSSSMARYSWEASINDYDDYFDQIFDH